MAKPFRPGDIFGVPLPDGSMATGQVLSLEPEAINSVGCLFLAAVVSAEGKLVGAPEPVAALLVTPDLLKKGVWPVKSKAPALFPPEEAPYEQFRSLGWVGAKIVGSANVQEFMAAYHGHCPWDAWHDPSYLDSLLLPGVSRPTTAVLCASGG